jgi:hypothetical protein
MRTALEPDKHTARIIDALQADATLTPHTQRVVLAIYLAHRADDANEIPVAAPTTPAGTAKLRSAICRWARQSGWYDTARTVLATG